MSTIPETDPSLDADWVDYEPKPEYGECEPCAYILFDGTRAAYIGHSCEIGHRLKSHRGGGYTRGRILWVNSIRDAQYLEAMLIRRFLRLGHPLKNRIIPPLKWHPKPWHVDPRSDRRGASEVSRCTGLLGRIS